MTKPAGDPAPSIHAHLRVAVIGGGISGEHEVSLAGARSATTALRDIGHRPVSFTITRSGDWLLAGQQVDFNEAMAALRACDVALPLVHGSPGEDGALGALCDFAGVPHTGPSVRAGALTMDKVATKELARSLGIGVAAGMMVARQHPFPTWLGPVVVKPAGGGSSLGVRLVERSEDLRAALNEAFVHDSRVLLEEPIAGREIDLAVLRRADGSLVCGPPLEVAHGGIFGYDDKYVATPDFVVPALLAASQTTRLNAAALELAEALESRGVIRVDFFLVGDEILLNEINAVPGLTDKSQVPLIFAAAGLPYPDLLDELLRAALAI